MVQRLERILIEFNDPYDGKQDLTYFVRDDTTGLLSVKVIAQALAEDIDTPTKVGDLLVGTYPDIDLPTTV